MKLVTLLLIIQIGLILAKSIDYKNCKDSTQNDRLKRSNEEDTSSTLSDFENIDPYNKQENPENKEEITEIVYQTNPNIRIVYVPNTDEENNEKIGDLTARNGEPETIIYKPVDPKYIVTFGPYLVKNDSKNATVVDAIIDNGNIDDKDTGIPNDDPVLLASDVASRYFEPNWFDNDNVTIDEVIDDKNTDLTNLRELRVKLLDHLLDYFLNIMKNSDGSYNHTRKSDDEINVEEKLRNYYTQHIDLLVNDDDISDEDIDSDYDINDDYRQGNDDEEISVEDEQNDAYVTENTLEGISLEVNVDKETDNVTSLDSLENINDTSRLDSEFNASNNSTDSMEVQVASKSGFNPEYVDLVQKEDTYNLMLNSTENYEEYNDNTYSNSTVIPETTLETVEFAENTTTGRNVLNSIEIVTESPNYEDGIVIIDDYSFEEYNIGSGESRVGKNIPLKAENNDEKLPPNIITTDDSQIPEDVLTKDTDDVLNNHTMNTEDDIQNDTDISDSLTPENVSKRGVEILEKLTEDEVKPILPNLSIKQGNINVKIPCCDNKNDDNSMRNKLKQRITEKSITNRSGKLLSKSIKQKSTKKNCRKSFVLNLNIKLL